MNKNNIIGFYDIHRSLIFNTSSNHRNYDLFHKYDGLYQYDNGKILLERVDQKKAPKLIGEYNLISWNFGLASEMGVDLCSLIKEEEEDNFDDIRRIIDEDIYKFTDYDRVIFITDYLLLEDFRKKDVSDEFFEHIYRTYYNRNTLIIMLVKPLQSMISDYDYFYNEKIITIKTGLRGSKNISISAREYYNLDNLETLKKYEDSEMNEIKLFGLASRIGFNRIGETYLFTLNPKKIINRLKYKTNEIYVEFDDYSN